MDRQMYIERIKRMLATSDQAASDSSKSFFDKFKTAGTNLVDSMTGNAHDEIDLSMLPASFTQDAQKALDGLNDMSLSDEQVESLLRPVQNTLDRFETRKTH